MGKRRHKLISITESTGPSATSFSPNTQDYVLRINDKSALAITFLFAGISYLFSFYYTSFYQGEEGAHYMNALGFWHSPESILGNWPKTGWKLIYAPIVLMGKQATLVANCLFSSCTAFFTYKIASKITGRKTVLPLILLFSQTLWFLLSFKFYSEILTAFLLSVAIYLFYNKRYFFSGLCFSYVLVLRQEFIFIIPYFLIYFLKNKHWTAFLSLGIFPVLYNIWGWYVSGDLLYSIHESQRTAALYKNSYPRQGFDHYFIMSGVIFNYVVITLVVLYLSQLLLRKVKKEEYPLLVTGFGFILVHCLFNFQSITLFTSTGGNLRYLLVVSPVLAILAVKAIDNLRLYSARISLLIFLVPFIILVAAKMTFHHNWVVMDTEDPIRDLLPLFFCSATTAVIFLPEKTRTRLIAVLCISSMLLSIKPKELCCDENYEQKKIVEYIIANGLDKKIIIHNLALFYFFYGKNSWDLPAANYGMNGDSSLERAPAGSIIIWDSHYAVKYGKVDLAYFNKNASHYKVLKEFRSEDNLFMAVVFEKKH